MTTPDSGMLEGIAYRIYDSRNELVTENLCNS